MRLPDRGDRRDQARVIVFDVADPQAHQSAYHFFGRIGGEQNLELGHIRRRFAKPNRPGPRFQRAFVLLYLASDDSSLVTGTASLVDGGASITRS
jgi:hypothetical protein